MICALCPESENEVPDGMIADHYGIMHPEQAAALDTHATTLTGVYWTLRQQASSYRGSPEYRKARSDFDAKPLDPTRTYKFARMAEFAAGIEAAAHVVEHMMAEPVEIVRDGT